MKHRHCTGVTKPLGKVNPNCVQVYIREYNTSLTREALAGLVCSLSVYYKRREDFDTNGTLGFYDSAIGEFFNMDIGLSLSEAVIEMTHRLTILND
jgi:hypothetical protein